MEKRNYFKENGSIDICWAKRAVIYTTGIIQLMIVWQGHLKV